MIYNLLDNFYLTAEQLENSPSRASGIDSETETTLRIYGCELIQEAGILLGLPQVVMATGQVLFQRFFCKMSMKDFSVKKMAASCAWVAAKLEESPRRISHVIMVFQRIINRREGASLEVLNPDSREFADSVQTLVRYERLLMRSFGFVMHVEHPHKWVLQYLQLMEAPRALMQEAWNIVNDSLRTTICVRFKSGAVACGSIFYAARRLKMALPENPPWWELFQVDLPTMFEVCRILHDLYSRPQAVHIPVYKGYAVNKAATPATPGTPGPTVSNDSSGGLRRTGPSATGPTSSGGPAREAGAEAGAGLDNGAAAVEEDAKEAKSSRSDEPPSIVHAAAASLPPPPEHNGSQPAPVERSSAGEDGSSKDRRDGGREGDVREGDSRKHRRDSGKHEKGGSSSRHRDGSSRRDSDRERSRSEQHRSSRDKPREHKRSHEAGSSAAADVRGGVSRSSSRGGDGNRRESSRDLERRPRNEREARDDSTRRDRHRGSSRPHEDADVAPRGQQRSQADAGSSPRARSTPPSRSERAAGQPQDAGQNGSAAPAARLDDDVEQGSAAKRRRLSPPTDSADAAPVSKSAVSPDLSSNGGAGGGSSAAAAGATAAAQPLPPPPQPLPNGTDPRPESASRRLGSLPDGAEGHATGRPAGPGAAARQVTAPTRDGPTREDPRSAAVPRAVDAKPRPAPSTTAEPGTRPAGADRASEPRDEVEPPPAPRDGARPAGAGQGAAVGGSSRSERPLIRFPPSDGRRRAADEAADVRGPLPGPPAPLPPGYEDRVTYVDRRLPTSNKQRYAPYGGNPRDDGRR